MMNMAAQNNPPLNNVSNKNNSLKINQKGHLAINKTGKVQNRNNMNLNVPNSQEEDPEARAGNNLAVTNKNFPTLSNAVKSKGKRLKVQMVVKHIMVLVKEI